MTEPFTKKHISDITAFEDRIDFEYLRRLSGMNTKQDLIDILKDYEEFLPIGLQKFRNADSVEFKELLEQVRAFFRSVQTGQGVPAEPTEAVMLCNPILLGFPRMLARKQSEVKKKHVTFGQAFLDLFGQGLIKKMLSQQEHIYREVIKVKNIVAENFDLKGELDGYRAKE